MLARVARTMRCPLAGPTAASLRALPTALLARAAAPPRPATPSPLLGVGHVCLRALSSVAGIERSGLPRLERDSRGMPVGMQKGGKGRKNLGGVLAIKNTWNNTLISISNSSYKQLGFVSGGASQRALPTGALPTLGCPPCHRLSLRPCPGRYGRLQEVKALLAVCH